MDRVEEHRKSRIKILKQVFKDFNRPSKEIRELLKEEGTSIGTLNYLIKESNIKFILERGGRKMTKKGKLKVSEKKILLLDSIKKILEKDGLDKKEVTKRIKELSKESYPDLDETYKNFLKKYLHYILCGTGTMPQDIALPPI